MTRSIGVRRSLLVTLSLGIATVTACGSDAANTAEPAATGSTSDGTDEFCAAARAFEEADPTGDVFAADDPAAIEREWGEFDSLLQQLVGTAPPEISADVETVAGTFGLLRTAYERAGWDALAVFDVVDADPELRAAFEGTDPEVEAAGERVSTYIDEECGPAPG